MAPTPVATQFPAPSAAHSTGYSANALITFYASISLLGCSVIFLVGYYAVKACKGSTTPTGKAGSMQPADSRKTRRHVIRHLVSSPHAPKVISQLAARLCPGQDGKASVDDAANDHSPHETQGRRRSAFSDWASAYLRHIRNMEDYAAGMPSVGQARPPTPTPPPLYSLVCKPSSATIGIVARDMPTISCLIAPSSDSEADITDIVDYYTMTTTSNSSFDSIDTPDTSFSDDLFPGIPVIIVDGCEDIAPPSYEEDIADQMISEAYLKVPDPKAKPVDRTPRMVAYEPRISRMHKFAPLRSKSPSILAKFVSREGFFRLPGRQRTRPT